MSTYTKIDDTTVDLSKRYWIFAFGYHDSYGGLDDIAATYDTYSEALAEAKAVQRKYNYDDEDVYIFDREKLTRINIKHD